MSTKTWTTATNGDFANTSNWTGGSPTNLDDAVLATDGGATYTASSSAGPTVNSIQTAANATLAITGSTFIATNGTGTGVSAGNITVANNSAFQVGGTFNNSGSISVNSGGNNTDLIIGSNTTLTGGGTIVMGDYGANRLYGASAATSLTNTDNTISGAGQLGTNQLTLVNQVGGIINATGTNNQLFLNTGANTVTNAGLIEASGAAGLVLQSNIANSGTVQANAGSHIELQGSTITGGAVTANGSGYIATTSGNSTLDGSSSAVTKQGQLNINNNTSLTLKGAISNAGSIAVNSGGNYTDLVIGSNTTLTGGGTIAMSDNGANRIYGATVATSLTNTNNTISGAGQLGIGGFTLVNQVGGIINATSAGNQLRIFTGTGSVANSGLIEATGSAGLLIQFSKIDNLTSGILLANTGSRIDLQSSTINGGVFKTLGTGVIDTVSGNTILDGTGTHKLVAPGNLVINNSTSITLQGSLTLSQKVGTVTTNGTLKLNSGGSYTDLIIGNKNASIAGGQIIMSDNSANRIYGTYTGGTKPKVSTLTTKTIISGSGSIGSNLILKNSGTINANGANALVIQTGNSGVAKSNVIANSGTLESTNSNNLGGVGGLHIISSVVANSSKGVILASGAGTHVDLSSATVTGGTLKTLSGGIFQTLDSGSVLDASTAAITSSAQIIINNATALTLKGAISNAGAIALNSGGNYTDLIIGSNTTLTGGGTIVMTDNSPNRIYGATAATSLTNTNNTISGAGQLGTGGLTLVNQAGGTINATSTNNALVISTGSGTFSNAGLVKDSGAGGLVIDTAGSTVSNTGLIEAAGAGGVTLRNTVINDSTGTKVQVDIGSHLDLNNATIVGGTLQISGTGFGETVSGNSTLDGSSSAVTKQGQLNINNNTSLTLKGAISNAGAIAVNSGGNYTDLVIGSNTTLTGGGTIVMGDYGANRLYGASAATSLTNTDNTISGTGQLGTNQLTLVNQVGGIINATGTNNQLFLNTGANTVTNAGLIEASGAAGLVLQSNIANSGTVQANAGSHIELQGITITGGAVTANGSGYIATTSGNNTLDGSSSAVTKQGQLNINNNTALTLMGAISNAGAIALNSGGNYTDLIIGSNTTLTGGGTIVMTDNSPNRIYGATAATSLTNTNNTISGAGQLGAGGLTLINQAGGTINATSTNNALVISTGSGTFSNAGLVKDSGAGGLVIDTAGSTVSNTGLIEAAGAGGVTLRYTVINDSTGTKVQVDIGSHLDLNNATIVGGTLQISGTGFGETVSGNSTLDGSSSAVTKQGQLNINNNTSLTLKGAISNAGAIALNSGGNYTDLVIGSNTTLTGGGTIVMTDNSPNRIYGATAATSLTNTNNTISGAGQLGTGGLTLVNQAGGTINATGTNNALVISTGTGTFSNAGLLEATGSAGLVIANAVANSGSIVANGGNVTVSGALTGAGTETLMGASVIEDAGASSNNVTFAAGATGTLKLDTAQSFTGSVTGFNSHNALDLANINNSTATTSFAGGVLTVTDGTTVAHIALVGSYAGATFAHSDDGSGHTKITVSGPGLIAQPLAKQVAQSAPTTSPNTFADWAHLLGATTNTGQDLGSTLGTGSTLNTKDMSLAAFAQSSASVH